MNLTTHFDLAPKFGISGAVHLLPPDMTSWCRQGEKKTVPSPEEGNFIAIRFRLRPQQLCLGEPQNNCYLAVDSNVLKIPIFRNSQLLSTERRTSIHAAIILTGKVIKILVCIRLGISPASDCCLPTFRNPLSVPSS